MNLLILLENRVMRDDKCVCPKRSNRKGQAGMGISDWGQRRLLFRSGCLLMPFLSTPLFERTV